MADQFDLFTEADKIELADLREFFHNIKFCCDNELDAEELDNIIYLVLIKHPHLAIENETNI